MNEDFNIKVQTLLEKIEKEKTNKLVQYLPTAMTALAFVAVLWTENSMAKSTQPIVERLIKMEATVSNQTSIISNIMKLNREYQMKVPLLENKVQGLEKKTDQLEELIRDLTEKLNANKR